MSCMDGAGLSLASLGFPPQSMFRTKGCLAWLGVRCGRKRVARLMRPTGNAGVCHQRKYRHRPSARYHSRRVHEPPITATVAHHLLRRPLLLPPTRVIIVDPEG